MELSQEAVNAIAKVEKLLNLARGNSNADEAQNAMDMAQQLLERYNLDMALVEASKRTDNARKDETRGGGLYKWQREVWEACAKLNFCVYRSIRGLERGSKYENRVIGSHVNVVATRLLADYLQDTIERLAREWAKDQGYNIFAKPVIIYREGMADRINTRLYWLRQERAEAERKRQAEAPTGTTLPSLVRVSQHEADLNEDYLHGREPGTTARLRAEREARMAEWTRKYEEQQAEHARRMLEDPDYAARHRAKEEEQKRIDAERAKKEAARERRREKSGYYQRSRPENEQDRRRSHSAYHSGYDKGGEIGLDPQVGKRQSKGIAK